MDDSILPVMAVGLMLVPLIGALAASSVEHPMAAEYRITAFEYFSHLKGLGWSFFVGGAGGIVGQFNDMGEDDVTLPAWAWSLIAIACFAAASFVAFHRVRMERDALRPRRLDHLDELIRRGISKDWMAPDNLKLYPGGPDEWVKQDNKWSSEIERELFAVAGEKYVERFKAVKFDDSKTPYWGGLTDEQQDRWRLRHARLEELVVIVHELEEKQ